MKANETNELSRTGGAVWWKYIKDFHQASILAAFLALFIFLSFATDSFFTVDNMFNLLRQASTSLIVAIGMTFVLILGGIDLSVGSLAALAGTVCVGLMTRNEIPVFPAILLGIGVGLGIGFINGIMSAKVHIPPFIVTLAMMSTCRGLVLVYTGGYPITNIPKAAIVLGRGYLGPVPVPVIIMLIVIVITWIILSCTKFGRQVFAVGGNEECARLSGVKVDRIKISVYMISGALAALAGIILTMRLNSGQPTLGSGMELDAIAIAVLGGTSLSGGKGYMLGTIIGCMFMTILTNGLNIMGISSFWQQVFTGIILLVAVSLYLRKKK